MTRAEAIARAKEGVIACLTARPEGASFGEMYCGAFPIYRAGERADGGRTAEGVSLSRCLDVALQQMKRDGVVVYSRKKGCWVRARTSRHRFLVDYGWEQVARVALTKPRTRKAKKS